MIKSTNEQLIPMWTSRDMVSRPPRFRNNLQSDAGRERSVAPARQALRRQQPRRFDSHAAHHDHHHAGPVNEAFGPGFYISIATLASGYLLYRVSKAKQESGSESWITGLIQKWTPPEELWERRNAIRSAAMDKAAEDRHLFMSAAQPSTIELKDPDIFNAGSPYNVAAGTTADLSAVAAHYHKKNQAMEEARVARMKDGKVVSLYE
ncbi:hypothetical protein DTO166G4_3095 [Paecilomyces variotii]|nr:hypothetical protein DTO164E3_6779 [Paecilomyces variotii]KAJ9215441.1 hypothetical protein DTO166G4_3095 [Paecilomyces variotii]KAJ9233669.1 hypothetical protein DTO166G5_5603 [Paecilomyces variotii]KAJ9256332.1 hypothetical protein DTO195F2_5908 [Paecilomyces variotii]KAJ9284206.1 hypothetical protein DTO021C3_8177 [Paecilomyces variotii]